ncbi:ArsR/SmtB family transcription factor [Streptomyces sp. x-19]|uniref:ArsR/SmtB family transcription factor n=1 Tax=Streptomyces sp. x-19 TaxID=2789280 RepID=UPI00398083F6
MRVQVPFAAPRLVEDEPARLVAVLVEGVLQAAGLLPGRLDEREQEVPQFLLPVSKATVTHHFRTLREAGLIRQVNRGNSRTATLRRADVEQRFPGLLALLTAEGAGDV